MNDDGVFLSATRQAELIRTKQASPVELLRAYLDRIDRLDGRLRAFITVTREAALAAARRARFLPATEDGNPVASSFRVAYRFILR